MLPHDAVSDRPGSACVGGCHAAHLGAFISRVHGEPDPLVLVQFLQELHESHAGLKNCDHVLLVDLHYMVESLHGDYDALFRRSAASAKSCGSASDHYRYLFLIGVFHYFTEFLSVGRFHSY